VASAPAHAPEADPGARDWLMRAGDGLGFAAILYYCYVAVVGIFSPEFDRSLFIFLGAVLAIAYYPLGLGAFGRLLDLGLIALAVVASLRFNLMAEDYALNVGMPLERIDIVLGWAMMLVSLEAGRRALGPTIPLIASLALFYLYRGDLVPAPFSHAGFGFEAIASHMFAGTEGLYGGITYILASQMLLFLVFGTFITRSGAADFYSDLCLSFLGHRYGGNAKAAVASSFIVGSVTGSAAANVAITGSMSIPMMIRTGFAPHIAGAIEAAASTGGTVLPPVMGVAAFVMVAITGIPYVTIVLYSVVPALLYFLVVYSQVHLYARRHNLGGIARADLPPLGATLRRGWVFLTPVAAVTALIYADYSLARIALLAAIVTIAASWAAGRRTAMSPAAIAQALVESARGALPILAVAGPVSIIAESVLLPGTSLRLTAAIIDLGGGQLGPTIAIIFLIAYILGMGLSVVPAYVVLATLAAPALEQIGVPKLTAHLLVMWWSQTSNITPPVALATYVAASIAKSSVWRTGNAAVIKGAAMFYLPVLFVYQPPLLLSGSLFAIVETIGTIALGTLALSAAVEGFFVTALSPAQRVTYGIAGVLLIAGSMDLWVVAGLALAVATFLWVRRGLAARPAPNDQPRTTRGGSP